MQTQISLSASAIAKKKKRIAAFKLLAVIAYIAGVGSILYYPQLANKTYISENALLPGGATIDYSEKDFQNAIKYSAQLLPLYKDEIHFGDPKKQSQIDNIVSYLNSIGIEAHSQKYLYDVANNATKAGYNIYAIVRAPKSSGTEALVLSTSFNTKDERSMKDNEVSGFGLCVSLVKHLQSRKWLAKDIIFVASDLNNLPFTYSKNYNTNRHLYERGIRAWLDDYLNPSIVVNQHSGSGMIRSGRIQAAINIDIKPSSKFEELSIVSEGSNGRLPNLDLINTIQRISRKEGLKDNQISLFPSISSVSSTINIQHLSIRIAKFVENIIPGYSRMFPFLNNLLTFMINQAIGVPTGNHGVFTQYHIDAITLTANQIEGSPYLSMVYFGRITESALRSLNNLLEHLHQSFYYYLLPSPFLYVSIGEYMISYGLVLFGFTVSVLFGILGIATGDFIVSEDVNKKKSRSNIETLSRNIMVYSLSLAGIYYFIGFLSYISVFILELFVPNVSEVWLIFVGVLIVITQIVIVPIINKNYKPKGLDEEEKQAEWMTVKVISYVPFILFVSTLSLINFSFCFFCSVFVVPIYAFLGPRESNNPRFIIKYLLQLILLTLSSPIALMILSSHYMYGTYNPSELVSKIILQHKLYSNLIFPFVCLVHIPLNLLGYKILHYV